MKNLKQKIFLIFIPFLIIAAGFIGGYTLLNWLLFVRNDYHPFREDIISIWLPFLLPWVPIFIWLKPRLKLLRITKENASFAFQFIASFTIAIPTMLAQNWLDTASGELTKLDCISEIQEKKLTKYYALENYYIDKTNIGTYSTADVSGKYSSDLNFRIYIVMPVQCKAADTIKGESSFFLGTKYIKTISNRLSDEEKQEHFKTFAEISQLDFDNSSFQNFEYLERTGNSIDGEGYSEAMKKCKLVSHHDPIAFIEHKDQFSERSGSSFGWIFKSFGIGLVVWFIMLLIPKLHLANVRKLEKGETEKSYEWREMFGLLIPNQAHFVLPIIINLNLLLNICMICAGLGFVSFRADDLLNWGGNYRPYVIEGQWWRLLTNIFLHGGLMHLVANMAGLLFAGIFLEPLLGRKRFLIVYLVTGIFASLSSIWWYHATVSVGASGAIFGLYGVFLVLMLRKIFSPEFSKSFLVSTAVFIGANLLLGFTGGIDNAAHIGGLAGGIIAGFILVPQLKKEAELLHAE